MLLSTTTTANNQAHCWPTADRKWLGRSIATGHLRPFAEIVIITPEVAREILSRNPANRKLDQKYAARIASDIRAGLWVLNGETIIISKDGELNDGQHRLLAIVISGIASLSLVFFGAERSSRLTVDMGVARTSANLMDMEGVANSAQKAATIPILMNFDRGVYYHRQNITKQQILHYYEAHQVEIDAAVKAVGHHKFSLSVGKSPIIAAYVVFARVDQEACDAFFYSFLTGHNLPEGDPILCARDHLTNGGRLRLKGAEKLELMIRYWNAWRQGKTLRRSFSVTAQWPEVL